MDLKEIQGTNGLFKIEKVKLMYYLGYGENIAYMINLDTMKVDWKKI